MTIKKIGVIGAGQMGHGIALVAAKSGFDVILRDIDEEFVKTGLKKIERFLDKSIEKGKMKPEEKNEIISNLKGTTNLNDLKEMDFVAQTLICSRCKAKSKGKVIFTATGFYCTICKRRVS